MLSRWLQDVRYAVRSLLGHPGYLITTLGILTLAIGFNTATFTVIDAVLLKPLPYQDPDRLVVIRERHLPELPEFSVSPGNYLAWCDRAHSFTAIALAGRADAALDTGTGDVSRVSGQRVTPNLFAVLGVSPLLGRGFTADDDRTSPPAVMLISYGAWQRRFGGAPVLGRQVRVNDRPVTIIGVMPPNFAYLNARTELWFPMAFTPEERQRYGSHYLYAVGRLKAGVTLDSARVDLNDVAAQLSAEHPDADRGWDVLAFGMQDFAVRDVRPALLLLLAAVAVVLLIACVNVANLLVARGSERARELAIRTALGASQSKIVGDLLLENAILSFASAALGLVVAGAVVRGLLTLVPDALPGQESIAIDGRVLVFALVLAVVTPLVFGLLPARYAARADVRELLAAGGRQGSAAPTRRIRTSLVIVEMAMATMLLIGAVLLVRSFARLSAVSPGFNPDRVVIATVSIPASRYASDDSRTNFFSTLVSRVKRVPGVEAAAITESVPLMNDYVSYLEIEGRPARSPAERQSANFYAVSGDYFRAMGIPLLHGRSFTDADAASAPGVSIINEEMARTFFPGKNPIGRRIRVPQGKGEWSEIVGVAGDVKQYGLDQRTTAQVYQPYRQHQYFSEFALVVRTRAADAASIVPDVRATLRALDPAVPLGAVHTLETVLSESVGSQRFAAVLIGVFGAAALLLAAVGLYGVLAYTVAQRMQEFAIRVAHGAGRTDLLRLVVGDGLRTSLLGTAIGLAGAIAARRAMAGLLFGISAGDPLTYAAAAAGLLAVAVAATAIPALRAANVDPIVALKGS